MNHDIVEEGRERDTGTPYTTCSCGASFRGDTRTEALLGWARHVLAILKDEAP